MADSYTTRCRMPVPALNDPDWRTRIDAMRDFLDGVNAIGGGVVVATETPSSTLNVKVSALVYRKADGTLGSYAGTSSQAISASTTKCLYLTDAGVLTVGSAWPTSGYYLPLAVVVAGASTITSIADARSPLSVVSGGATSGTATLVAGTVTVTTAAVAAGSIILVSRRTAAGTLGQLSIGTVTAGTSFTIVSTTSETSTVSWWIKE